jgi:cobalt-zinc-cadmium efflux system outer membrane protein
MMLSLLLCLLVGFDAPADQPAQAPPPPVPLEQAVSAVLAASPLRQAAEATATAAVTAAGFAGAWPNPSVDVRAENWRFGAWNWTPTLDPSAPPSVDFFAVLAQPIELGGERGARRAMADAQRDGARAGLSQVERGLVMETIRLYLDALLNREALASLDSNREGLEVLTGAMTARVREGFAAEADLAKFQAETARVNTQILRARVELNRSLARLNALVGQASAITVVQLVRPILRDVPAGDAGELARLAVDRSPDVQAARARQALAGGALLLQQAMRVPDVTVVGGYKRTAGFDAAIMGVTIPVPLFDRNKRGLALASGDAHATERARAAVEAMVLADARAAIEAARLLAERARHVDDDMLAPAGIARTAALSAFREGASDILGLVDAERVYLEAHREALRLKLDATAAAIEVGLLRGERVLQ